MLRFRPTALLLAALAAAAAPAAARAQTKLLRYPDIHGDRIVFTYAGDLWLAPSQGGTATRLTAHEAGIELFAGCLPDLDAVTRMTPSHPIVAMLHVSFLSAEAESGMTISHSP